MRHCHVKICICFCCKSSQPRKQYKHIKSYKNGALHWPYCVIIITNISKKQNISYLLIGVIKFILLVNLIVWLACSMGLIRTTCMCLPWVCQKAQRPPVEIWGVLWWTGTRCGWRNYVLPQGQGEWYYEEGQGKTSLSLFWCQALGRILPPQSDGRPICTRRGWNTGEATQSTKTQRTGCHDVSCVATALGLEKSLCNMLATETCFGSL